MNAIFVKNSKLQLLPEAIANRFGFEIAETLTSVLEQENYLSEFCEYYRKNFHGNAVPPILNASNLSQRLTSWSPLRDDCFTEGAMQRRSQLSRR